jgi:nitrogen fixation/metabolism regulation signal transduction histidine kinase
MFLLLAWLGTALVLLGFTLIYLFRKGKKRTRFQLKLTALFLLFVLVPFIPLTFFTANLLTRSADWLLLPGLDKTLDSSLETIRIQAEEKGRQFFKKYPDFSRWRQTFLKEKHFSFLGTFQFRQGQVVTSTLFLQDTIPESSHWIPSIDAFQDILQTGQTSRLFYYNNSQHLLVYQPAPDSVVALVGYPLTSSVIQAHDNITQALAVYNTLSLIKESIITNRLIWGVAILLVLGLAFFAVLIARNLSRGISEPIDNLVKGMHRVAEDDLSTPVCTQAKDEFRFLVDTFNRMMDELKISRDKIRQAERMAAWQLLARQISHEIKNSLTPITLSVRRLKGKLDDHDRSGILESLKAIEDEIQSLENMAKTFSEFAKMPDPKKEPINLNELIRSVVTLIEPTLKQIKIRTVLSSDIGFIQADRDQMKRMFINLIKNAVEASPKDGSITVTSSESHSDIHTVDIEIKDQGDGLDPELTQKIFHPYFTTKPKGTGLGLPIVQKIIENHQGEINVTSIKGEGTIFTISI